MWLQLLFVNVIIVKFELVNYFTFIIQDQINMKTCTTSRKNQHFVWWSMCNSEAHWTASAKPLGPYSQYEVWLRVYVGLHLCHVLYSKRSGFCSVWFCLLNTLWTCQRAFNIVSFAWVSSLLPSMAVTVPALFVQSMINVMKCYMNIMLDVVNCLNYV
jgi:hypothetical protein